METIGSVEILAYIPSPPAGEFYLGPLALRGYALSIIAGIIIAVWWSSKRWSARGGNPDDVMDIALWAVPFGIVGGRIYHVITDWQLYFGADAPNEPIDALKIWNGGLGIWGAVALGGFGAWIACKRKGIPLGAFGDAVAPGIVLAQGIGRLGNWFNQELYGRPTTVPWGLEIFVRDNNGLSTGEVATIVHPTFLYEMICNFAIAVILVWADRRFNMGHGRVFALYVALYCVGRFFVELMRDDPANHILGLRVNTIVSVVVFVGAVIYLLVVRGGRENPADIAASELSHRNPALDVPDVDPQSGGGSEVDPQSGGGSEVDPQSGGSEVTVVAEKEG